MKWFKHDSDFRQRPYMKFIQRRLGAEGVAAAYRLLEVMAESLGKDDNTAGTLTLSPPYTDLWLADELGLYEGDSYSADYPSVKKLNQFLNVFQLTRFVELGETTVDGVEISEDEGKLSATKVSFRTITVPGFVRMIDEYTARKISKGVRCPE